MPNNITYYGYINDYYTQKFYDYYGFLSDYYINNNNFITFVNSNPREYNSSQTIINNNTVTTSENINYNYYFAHLKTNFANNQYDSCGFISIASLLTYYDFFYNNDFVNDSATYSNDHRDTSAFIKSAEAKVYSTSDFTCSPGYDDSFQYYLIDEIAIDELNINFSQVNGNPVYSTTNNIIKNVIERYLEVTNNISSTYYSVNILSTEAAIKNEIDCGRPVIISLSSFEYESEFPNSTHLNIISMQGHAAIAYGYKELSNGETIYRCHLGWHGSALSGCTYDSLVRNLAPSISGVSFVYTGSTNNCNDNVYLYNHSDIANASCFGLCHKHSGYKYYLDRVIISSHDYYYCPICHNCVLDEPHIHDTYTYYNLYNHYVTCLCGYSGYESHVVGTGPFLNGYYKCLYCHGFMDGGNIHNKINPPYIPNCHK